MDNRKLKSKLVLRGYNTEKVIELLNDEGVSMSRSAWFRKMKGETEFDRKEIQGLADVLGLTKEDVIDIFFDKEVS